MPKDCKFGNGLDEKLRDRFVTGINDPRMTKNLITVAEDKLDLKKAVEVAQALELANEHSNTLQKENPSPASASVDVLHPPQVAITIQSPKVQDQGLIKLVPVPQPLTVTPPVIDHSKHVVIVVKNIHKVDAQPRESSVTVAVK